MNIHGTYNVWKQKKLPYAWYMSFKVRPKEQKTKKDYQKTWFYLLTMDMRSAWSISRNSQSTRSWNRNQTQPAPKTVRWFNTLKQLPYFSKKKKNKLKIKTKIVIKIPRQRPRKIFMKWIGGKIRNVTLNSINPFILTFSVVGRRKENQKYIHSQNKVSNQKFTIEKMSKKSWKNVQVYVSSISKKMSLLFFVFFLFLMQKGEDSVCITCLFLFSFFKT